MNASVMTTVFETSAIHQAVSLAIDTIAPTWPLDRMIAVNPYWGRKHQPFATVAKELAVTAGSRLSLPACEYRKRWRSGEIIEADLQRALAEQSLDLSVASALAALDSNDDALLPLPLLSDSVDAKRDLQRQPAWCDTVTHQISQFCAAYFDRDQADWHPDQQTRLFDSWRTTLMHDHGIALLMETPKIAAKATLLSSNAEAQIEASLRQLGVPPEQWQRYLEALLMRVSGWAAWCAYRRWQARLADGDDNTLVDLLAIRLSWETLLDDGQRDETSVWRSWRTAWQQHCDSVDSESLAVLMLWQRAHEISYQRQLGLQLLASGRTTRLADDFSTPSLQAAFCIDVRSEVIRRHLESQSPRINTLGFAGFFGLPISYTPVGTAATRPQLPGLLAPAYDVSDSSGDKKRDLQIAAERQLSLAQVSTWRTFQSLPLSSFTVVETLGLAYLAKLIKRTLASQSDRASEEGLGLNNKHRHSVRPMLDASVAGGVAGQTQLAKQVLRGMGLTTDFARTVLLVGHGSQTRNNPHRAGLDCGACCGQTGEVNARTLAGLLNSSAVRQNLWKSGIEIPDSTCFIAALHNTTTDEIELFDIDDIPASHLDELERLKQQLASASVSARRERASQLGLEALVDKPESLLRAVKERANDWAQTRPEWGLANNAAFIIAPRERTRGINLAGRSFLHDYDHRLDTDGSLLEQIMTAPMVVTNWINMQYFASTVDNRRFGSGNKTLHNVVGGRIGVFEGNGGDLRIGLSWQSLHNGQRWTHAPLRLSVVIDAPRACIEVVIDKHETVRQLVHNRWLYVMRMDDGCLEHYDSGCWQAAGSADAVNPQCESI